MAPPSTTPPPPRVARDDFPALSSRVVARTLANGLRVIVLPRGEAPVASFHTYVDVGSVDERPGITGIAHMFEHMAFKGSRRIGTRDWKAEAAALAKEEEAYLAWRAAQESAADGESQRAARDASLRAKRDAFEDAAREALALVASEEFSSAIERAGGVGLNATTGTDATQYFYSLPANKLELWAWLESERFTDPVLREFYKERDVVHEERRLRTDSNPQGKLVEESLLAAFDGHPYGRPVIGFQADLDRFSRTEAEEFHRQTYGPSKMVLAVVGKVDAQATHDVIARYFERIPANRPAPPPPDPGPRAPGERRVEVPLAAQPIWLAIFRRPSVRHPDDAAYTALADLLGGGTYSRLHRAVVKSGLAVVAQAFPTFPGEKYSTGFGIWAMPSHGHTLAEVEAAIGAEIERLARDGCGEAEMEGVRLRAKTEFLLGIESNDGLARELARHEAILGGWAETFRQLSRFEAVTARRVQDLARDALAVSNRTVATIVPANPAAAAAAGAADA